MKRSRIDELICRQEKLDHLTRKEIEAVQLRKLNRLLSCEKGRGGFYRDLPERLGSLQELAELPFTTEEDLVHCAPGLLLTSQSEIFRVLSDATSGTTGQPKRVFYTLADLENTICLYVAGLGELIFPGDTVMICFPFSGPGGLGELIAEAVVRLKAKPLKLGASLTYGALCAVLEEQQPDCFVGMPVQLLSLLRTCGRKSLRRALVSGDACPESVLRESEAILGSRIFPHYGSREMGMAGAITCQAHSGMHLRENHIIAEIVSPDGKRLPPGETGELVITTVGMEALPLIRYRTGDRTCILWEPCPCGSETIRLGNVQRCGREADMSVLDERLFGFDCMVDYLARKTGKGLRIEALTCGAVPEGEIVSSVQALFPDQPVSFSSDPVKPDNRMLYTGKRRILCSQS